MDEVERRKALLAKKIKEQNEREEKQKAEKKRIAEENKRLASLKKKQEAEELRIKQDEEKRQRELEKFREEDRIRQQVLQEGVEEEEQSSFAQTAQIEEEFGFETMKFDQNAKLLNEEKSINVLETPSKTMNFEDSLYEQPTEKKPNQEIKIDKANNE